MAPRFNRVLFYLQEAKKAGAEPSELIGEALKLIPADKGMAEFYWDPNMVRDQVLDAFATCQEWRVFGSRSNLEKLKHGNSATIQAGDFAGETVEFDHRIPVSQAPELQNNFTGIP